MTSLSAATPDELSPRAARPWRAAVAQPRAAVSIGYLLLVTAVSVTAGVFAPYDPVATDLDHVLSGPTGEHLLGTDSLGRDVVSRLMYGGQISLVGVAEAVVTVLVLSVPAGLVAGFFGGWFDRTVTWVIDIVLAVPVIVTLLVVLAVFGSNESAAMLALGVLGAPGIARVVRGATLAVRQELYIAAAKVTGLPNRQIIVKHVLPRVAGPIIVQTSIFAGVALLVQTGLGYLGLGVQPPTPTWGGMVAEASRVIDQQPWLLVPAGTVIGLTILAFGLLGDAVRDATAQRSARNTARSDARWAPAATGATSAKEAPLAGHEAAGLLSLRGVTLAFPTADGPAVVVEGLDLDIRPGETVGLVGESGCGKSVTGRAILGLLPDGGRVTSGRIIFDGADITALTPRALRKYRGSKIALVAQEPVASLDPAFTVGRQLEELVRRHNGGSRANVRARAIELLSAVNLPNAQAVARRYPHQLSGGMAQRVGIAMALAGEPELLIADEPTTALDVTAQAEILDLLRQLQRDTGMSILLITHDWGVVADICHRAYVMYAGHMVESATVVDMFDQPRHPYTAGLLGSTPQRSHRGGRLPAIPGTVPDPRAWPAGCRFHPRCPLATAECAEAPIPLTEPQPGHVTRCIHQDQVEQGGGRDHAASAPRRP